MHIDVVLIEEAWMEFYMESLTIAGGGKHQV
jgi:hypothetical protein